MKLNDVCQPVLGQYLIRGAEEMKEEVMAHAYEFVEEKWSPHT